MVIKKTVIVLVYMLVDGQFSASPHRASII